MAILKGQDIERFVRTPDRKAGVILIYGPDGGLVHERSRAIARGLVDQPDDPFELIRMDGDDIAGDPARLADEAQTLGLFGGRRALWVRLGSRPLQTSVETVLAGPVQNPVVIEAGDLPAKHALRALIEKAPQSVVIPCYADEARDLPRLIDDMAQEVGLTVDRDARDAMIALLGADRLLSRREIEKVLLYAHGKGRVTLDDIEAVMADASALSTDQLVDAVFDGDAAGADTALHRALREGQDAGVIVGALLRHAFLIAKTRLAVDRGTPIADAERSARIFFKRSAIFRRHIQLWSASAIDNAIVTLGEAQAACRRQSLISASLASRVCLTLAIGARRARAGRD